MFIINDIVVFVHVAVFVDVLHCMYTIVEVSVLPYSKFQIKNWKKKKNEFGTKELHMSNSKCQ